MIRTATVRDVVKIAVPVTLGITLAPGIAQAYVGPGAGLTAIGTMLALFAAVVLAVIGFVWFPIKRLLRKREQRIQIGSDSSLVERDGK